MSEIKLMAREPEKVTAQYLGRLNDDELLQVYVIAGVFAAVEGYTAWHRPTRLARKKILLRMKDRGG